MRLELDRIILDRLSDPVLVLDDHGDVVGFNPAARAFIRSAPDLLITLSALVHAALTQVGSQALRLNPPVPLTANGQSYIPWLMPTREYLALLLLPDDRDLHHVPPRIGTQADMVFSALLSAETRIELHRLIDRLGSSESEVALPRPELRRVHRLLTTIDMMCSVLQRPESVYGDRLVPQELVQQALSLRKLPASCLTLSGMTRAPGPRYLYGHAPWLLWALDVLLERICPTGKPDAWLPALLLHHADGSLVLSGSCAESRPPDASPPGIAPREVVKSGPELDLDVEIRLSLARNIVEYHGGHLQLLENREHGVPQASGFQLAMPLGRSLTLTLPPRGQWVSLDQAEVLARDLALLLPRRTTRDTPLPDGQQAMPARAHSKPDRTNA